MNSKMVLNTSDEAAQFKTGLSGWVSRGGRFWGNDERMARYDGCTHIVCDCGKPFEKGWTKCEACRAKSQDDVFNSYPKQVWDGKTPLTLFDGDEYFFDYDSLACWCDDNDEDINTVRLMICKPNYAREIDSDYYEDDLPQDECLDDVAPDLAEMIRKVNEYIRESRPILSWSQSNIVAVISGNYE